MSTKLAALIILTLAAIGCSKPSIVGKWQTTWTGDDYGTSTRQFNPNGTYSGTTESGNTKQDFKMRDSEEGAYTLDGDKLSLIKTGAVIDYLNADGTVKRSVPLQKPTPHTWSNIKYSGNSFTLGDPDGVSTGSQPQVYQRVP